MFHVGVSTRFSIEKMKELPYLLPEDVANAVIYVLGTPPHVQVTYSVCIKYTFNQLYFYRFMNLLSNQLVRMYKERHSKKSLISTRKYTIMSYHNEYVLKFTYLQI